MSLRVIAFAVLGLVVGTTALLVWADARWDRNTHALRATLSGPAVPASVKTFDAQQLDSLPLPVRRYFMTALTPGQGLIESARFSHNGSFNSSETGERWSPFTSDQVMVADPPGFDWDARIRMAPGITVFVHDAYVAGSGLLHASVFGLFRVAHTEGTRDVAEGELMRYLAECAWYPTRLLPVEGITWTGVSDSEAVATLSDGATSVSLTFRFGNDGLISSVRAEARARLVQGRITHAPWEGKFWNYERRDGMMIPLGGEVAWQLPDRAAPYWRGHLKSATYRLR